MPTLQVFFDYACPYCLKGHQNLVELAPKYPDITIEWHPCEAHPRPERYGPHSDLCIRGMFFAREQGIDLWVWHQRMYAACLTNRIDVEDVDTLANYVKDLVDSDAFRLTLKSGRYETELQAANDFAYESSGVWVVPAYRLEGRRVDAIEDVGVPREKLKAFLDLANAAR